MDGICSGLVLGFLIIGLGRIVLWPLFANGSKALPSAQFQVADLATLVWLLAIALGAAHAVDRQGHWGYFPDPDNRFRNGGYRMIAISGALLAASLWWIGLRTVNRLGIKSPLSRVFVCGFLFPYTYTASTAVLTLWIFASIELWGTLLLAAYVVLLITLAACRRMATGIVSRQLATALPQSVS
jgi:hypothetical protein